MTATFLLQYLGHACQCGFPVGHLQLGQLLAGGQGRIDAHTGIGASGEWARGARRRGLPGCQFRYLGVRGLSTVQFHMADLM